MKDLYNHLEVVSLLPPIGIAADQTFDDIDLAGFDSAVILIHIGLDVALAVGAYWEFILSDSADGTTYALVETADVLGAGTIAAGVILKVDDVLEDNAIYKFGYVGGKRYLRLTIDETGALTGPISITLIKGAGENTPAIV